MFGIALAIAGVSLLAFLIVLALGLRFFGALAGNSATNSDPADERSHVPTPHFTRFDLPKRKQR